MRGLRNDRFIATAFVILFVYAAPSLGGSNHWTSSGPEGASISFLVVNPDDTSSVYAGTEAAGVFRMTLGDDLQWEPFNSGLTDPVITALTFDGPTLYAGTGSGRMFARSDSTGNWTEIEKPETGAIRAIAVDHDRGRIFVATNKGIMRSSDRGRSWRSVPQLAGSGGTVAVTPNGNVYAAMWSPPQVAVSFDGGDSWKPTTLHFARALAVAPNSNIYAAEGRAFVMRSADNGQTWTSLPYLEGSVASLTVSGNAVVAATERGLYRNIVGSQVWTRIGIAERVTSMVQIGTDFWLVGTRAGAFRTGGGTTNWLPTSAGLNAASVTDLAVGDDDRVQAATPGGLWQSIDGGRRWRNAAALTLPVDHVEANGQDVYVAGSKGMGISRDGGETWKVLNSYRASSIALGGTGALYASFQEAISRSTDGGMTWRSLTTGFDAADYFFYYGYGTSTLAADRDDPDTAYVGFGHSLFMSTTGGAKWVLIDQGRYPDLSVSVAGTGNVVYVGRLNGIDASVDGGRTFGPRQLTGETINTIAVDPEDPGVAYAGTESGYVYRSVDYGQSWTSFKEGLTGAPIRRLVTSRNGKRIYAATGAGAFEYEIAPPLDFDRLPDDPSRLPRLLRGIVTGARTNDDSNGARETSTPAFVLPAVGTVHGARGTFRTDVTLSNGRRAGQDVLLAWLAQGNMDGPDVPSFRVRLPALGDETGGTMTIADITDELGLTGLGSMIVIAVDSHGEVDASAAVDGFARVRSTSSCSSGSVSQSLPAVTSPAFAPSRRARALGLRHETAYRTNAGVVNLGETAREFTFVIDGQRGTERFTVSVPPFAPLLTAIPDGNYGALAITVISEGSEPWIAYGSTVDNASGDSWSAVAMPLGR